MKPSIRSIVPIILSALLLFGAAAGAEERGGYPLGKLSGGEIEQLERGEPFITVLDSAEELSLREVNEETRRIVERFRGFDPNFLAEAYFLLPVPEGSEKKVLEEVKWALQEVTSFQQIPYYSEEQEKWYPLFTKMKIKELPIYGDHADGIITSQELKPFDPYTAVYRYELEGKRLLYTSWNKTALIYKGFRGVSPEEMYTALYAEAREGAIFFYGLGGAKAFTFFGLFSGRMDQAFTGRVRAFFSWFYRDFVSPRLEEYRRRHAGSGEELRLPELPEPYDDPPEVE